MDCAQAAARGRWLTGWQAPELAMGVLCHSSILLSGSKALGGHSWMNQTAALMCCLYACTLT